MAAASRRYAEGTNTNDHIPGRECRTMSSSDPTAAVDLETLLPPVDPRSVKRVAYFGIGLCAASAVLGVVASATDRDVPGLLSTLRLLLAAVGAVSAGAAVSMAGRAALPWFLAGVGGLAAGFLGTPAHWDSLSLLLCVLGFTCLLGGVLLSLHRMTSQILLVTMVGFHFASIFCATTWPEPAPWLTTQLGQRVFLPFMQFTYLRNAYHFYSPDPGPANLLFILLDTEETDPTTKVVEAKSSWILLPQRGRDTRDPLGVSYYRRLSLTESAARVSGDLGINTDEKKNILARREDVALGTLAGHKLIPYAPESFEPRYRQHLQPTPDATRYILPSYARHIAVEYTRPGVTVKKVRLYRAEHKIVTTQFFVTQKMSPYYPTLFRVYFLGDYTPEGKLIDPVDPMLYWVVPILPKSGKRSLTEANPDDIDDYLSKHAGYVFDWKALRP